MRKVKVSDADIHRHRLNERSIALQKPAKKNTPTKSLSAPNLVKTFYLPVAH